VNRAIIRLRPAEFDLLDIFVYLGRKSPQAADRFFEAAERTFVQLAAQPGIGAPHPTGNPRLADLRVSPVTRFRSYLVFYRATDDRLEVFRVLHAARDVDQALADAFGPPDGPGADGPEE
jgi:toxin ParE1/3/4